MFRDRVVNLQGRFACTANEKGRLRSLWGRSIRIGGGTPGVENGDDGENGCTYGWLCCFTGDLNYLIFHVLHIAILSQSEAR
jgi:hypothetical protein